MYVYISWVNVYIWKLCLQLCGVKHPEKFSWHVMHQEDVSLHTKQILITSQLLSVMLWLISLVYGHNATDKTPMYEMPLTFVFGGWGFGVMGAFFVLAFCQLILLGLAQHLLNHWHFTAQRGSSKHPQHLCNESSESQVIEIVVKQPIWKFQLITL